MLDINDSALALHTNSLVPQFNPAISPLDLNSHLGGDRPHQLWSQFEKDLITESVPHFAQKAVLEPRDTSSLKGDPLTQWNTPNTLALPSITVRATDPLAGETNPGQTPNPGRFSLTRTGSTANSLIVNYTLTGTATKGVDYNNLSGRVTFARGVATANVDITAINDTAVEANETVIFNISNSTTYSVGTSRTATVTIADNDKPAVPPGTLQQVKRFGTSQKDLGMGIATDSLGNTYVTGFSKTTTGYGSMDSWVAKYNSAGARVWYKPFSTPDIPPTQTGSGLFGGYFDDLAVNIAVDSANNVYLGMTSQFHGGNLNNPYDPDDDEYLPNSDVVMIKMNGSGNILWQKRYDNSIEDIAWDMTIDHQGNAYLGGYGSEGQGAFLMKYTTNGTRQWVKRLGDSATAQIREIATDKAGNIYVAGKTYGNGYDSWFGKYNSSGTLLWTKTLVASQANDDSTGIATDSNGNVYITGNTGYNSPTKAWMIKANSNGTVLWNRSINNTNSLAYGYQDLAVDGAGNAYISGIKGSSAGVQAVVRKFTSSGQFLWESPLGGSSGATSAENIHLNRNGRIFLTGFTTSNLPGTPLGQEDAWFGILSNN